MKSHRDDFVEWKSREQERERLAPVIVPRSRSGWQWAGAVLVVASASAIPATAAIKKAEGPIPDLKPPTGEIPFSVPEPIIYTVALAVAFGALIIGRVRVMMQPKPIPIPDPPIVVARQGLAAINGPAALEECERVIRRYLRQGFGVGREGTTASELCSDLAVHPLIDEASLRAVMDYFSESELTRFAPVGDPGHLAENCVQRATALIEHLEGCRTGSHPVVPAGAAQ